MSDSPTIGVVTALPKEFAAFELMLDSTVSDTVVDGDPGRYVVGRVGAHVVVLALLPKMGLDPATAVSTHLLRSFPGVMELLMVGIAGGIPHPSSPQKHVRLGDVVVSSSQGVVQFDAGRIDQVLQDGRAAGARFTIRSSAPLPSTRLLQEVRILEARRARGERPWEAFMARAAPLERSARPGDALDVLHDPVEPARIVPHPTDPDRRPGHPRLHDGVIASSNALLKDPQLRDFLRDQHDVRAVEMEGHGIAVASWIAGRAGYFLVRGICDYCDSFKNDFWQEYSAAAAAAFARAVLVSLPSSTALSPQTATSSRQKLRAVLRGGFNREELEQLCADIQDDLAASNITERLSLDIVGGNSLDSRSLNLLTYLERRGYLSYLERAVARARPLAFLA